MFENEIRAGIALLDQRLPNWREKINKATLNMNLVSQCILGQLFGHFDDGAIALFGANASEKMVGAHSNGFEIPDAILWGPNLHMPMNQRGALCYVALTNEWLAHLQ